MPPLIVDERGITKDLDGIIRVDDIILLRVVDRGGKPYVQVKDYDRRRIKCRHTYFVEIPLEIFIAKLTDGTSMQELPPPIDELEI